MKNLFTMTIGRHDTQQLCTALGLLFIVGYSSQATIAAEVHAKQLDEQTKETDSAAPYSAHVAFAGGGWRAHTGHSAWTMSLLESSSYSMEDAFKNIRAISSNSGGSWFSTMLTFSGSFVNAIESNNALQTWSKSGPAATGWLGQQQYLFDQAPCHLVSGDAFLACVFSHYTGSLKDATYWEDVVTDIVFHHNKVGEPLSGKRQTWAKDKPLLLAATLLTNEAVLGEVGDERQYYQACLSPSTPMLKGHKGASCQGSAATKTDVTPVTFSSVPSSSGAITPPFFSAAEAGSPNSYFNVGYSENSYTPEKSFTTAISNPIKTEAVPVMIAASASSAAAGFAASRAVSGSWIASYLASDEALNFQLKGGIKYVKANGIKAKDLAASQIVQIADGGAVDNSAVAQLVSFLQQNNEDSEFNIVAFDNVQQIHKPGNNAPHVGIDIANLFGEGLWNGNQICSGANGKGYCVTVPDLKIFDPSALTKSKLITWNAKAKSNDPAKNIVHELIYTKYRVTTVDNSAFGIKGGTTGTLHAFTAAWSDADTAPQDKEVDGDFKAYGKMLNFINVGLRQVDANGNTGLKYLKEAFGL